MGILELLLLAVALSMDAFAVSICKGLCLRKASAKAMLTCGVWFGLFQGLMPLIGFYLGSLFAGTIQAIDHWIAFALLALIGIHMIREAHKAAHEDYVCPVEVDFSFPHMFTMAIATSIDALAVGISLSLTGGVNIWMAVILIAVITFLFSAAGVKIGSVFGNKYEAKAQFLGGLVLILLGSKILLEHLGVINF